MIKYATESINFVITNTCISTNQIPESPNIATRVVSASDCETEPCHPSQTMSSYLLVTVTF